MSQINSYSDINLSTVKGRLLAAAIDILSGQENIRMHGKIHIGQNMSNDHILDLINKRADSLFPASQEMITAAPQPESFDSPIVKTDIDEWVGEWLKEESESTPEQSEAEFIESQEGEPVITDFLVTGNDAPETQIEANTASQGEGGPSLQPEVEKPNDGEAI